MLKFLGKGSAFDLETNSCAYFEYENELFLIDIGENTFKDVKNLLDNNSYSKVNVLITHTHADHVNGLSTLSHYLFYIKKIRLEIHAQKTMAYSIELLMDINGNDKDQFFIKGINSRTVFSKENGDLHYSYVKTEHVDNLDCYGILIRHKDYCIYYSGDSKTLPESIQERLSKNHTAYLTHYYQDISLIDYEGNVHMSEKVFNKTVKPLIKNKDIKVFFYHNSKYNPNQEITL